MNASVDTPETENPADPDAPPDLHDLTRQLAARKADLVGAAGREAELRWTVEHLRRELAVAGGRAAAETERFEAMRVLLDACAASGGPFGLRRRRFLTLVRRAAQAIPRDGPGLAGHAVLDAEARGLLSRLDRRRGD